MMIEHCSVFIICYELIAKELGAAGFEGSLPQ
jgi:hypothetical protein